MDMATAPLKVRFWAKVRITPGCWWWTGNAIKGYGRIRRGGSDNVYLAAHRYGYEWANGPIPDGLGVLHHCDNPRCVNPDHLFLGTNTENVADMVSKGRHNPGRTFGEDQWASKLTPDEVRTIRWLYPMYSQQRIGAWFGISQATVSWIIRRRGWAWVM